MILSFINIRKVSREGRKPRASPSVFNNALGTLRMLMNGISCLIPLLKARMLFLWSYGMEETGELETVTTILLQSSQDIKPEPQRWHAIYLFFSLSRFHFVKILDNESHFLICFCVMYVYASLLSC